MEKRKIDHRDKDLSNINHTNIYCDIITFKGWTVLEALLLKLEVLSACPE